MLVCGDVCLRSGSAELGKLVALLGKRDGLVLLG
jgi:hypothetical protein